MYNYAELCPTFWKRLGGGALDDTGRGTYMDMYMSVCREVHTPLRDKLGLDKGTWGYEEKVDMLASASFSTSTKLLLALLPEEEQKIVVQQNYVPLMNNKLSTGEKVSKYLSKVSKTEAVGRLIPMLAQGSIDLSNLKTELPKLPEDMEDPLTLLFKFPVLIQNFYSEVAAIQDVVFGISMDFPNFVEAANSDNYTSCYAVGGVYERAPLNLSVTPGTFVFYAKSKAGGFLGRCWGMVSPDYSQITLFQPYGFLNKDVVDSALWWMADKFLNDQSKWAMWTPRKAEESCKIDGRIMLGPHTAGIWSDPVYRVLSRLTEEHAIRYQPEYDVRPAPCLACGKIHMQVTMLCKQCSIKYSRSCISCGKQFFSFNSKLRRFCAHCLNGTITCPKCGTLYREGMEECPGCHWKSHCSLCGKQSSTPLYKVGDVFLCRDCKEILLDTTCDVCGSKGTMYPAAGLALCSTCFSEATRYEGRSSFTNNTPWRNAINYVRECLKCNLSLKWR